MCHEKPPEGQVIRVTNADVQIAINQLKVVSALIWPAMRQAQGNEIDEKKFPEASDAVCAAEEALTAAYYAIEDCLAQFE